MFKSAIRINKIKTIAQLRGMTLHAERRDQTGQARVREGAEAGYGLAWSKAENDRDYLAAFKAHKLEFGAKERKNAPLCMQALCVVSPEWIEQAGDLHDADNPHNQQLFEQSKAWSESWAGEGSVFGVRLDLDEKGGGVVDLMISPVRTSRGKPVISTQKALTELKGATNERNEYSALQTSWAEWCGKELDENIARGTRREITAREHLSPETYGMVMDKARESLREPPETLLEAIKHIDIPHESVEHLKDYLTLKGEISRHKSLKDKYEPPKGKKDLSDIDLIQEPYNLWPFINEVREGAEQIMNITERFNMSFIENSNDRYEKGRSFFPSLIDRMHLSAVVAKCAAFCAKAEAFVKNQFLPKEHTINPDHCWPSNAKNEVQRHEHNLGIQNKNLDHEKLLNQIRKSQDLSQDDDLGL